MTCARRSSPTRPASTIGCSIARLATAALLTLVAGTTARAQEAVTITGRVFAEGTSVRGASVRIDDLSLSATTDAQGRYSFIIPSSRVRGQTVTMVARYPRHEPGTVSVRIVGGSLAYDFDLRSSVPEARPGAVPGAERRDTITALRAGPMPGAPGAQRPALSLPMPGRQPLVRGSVVDSTAFVDLAGSADLPSALAGRLAGVEVRSAASPGGSTAIQVRGAHTLVGRAQPLFVLNGIILDNASVATTRQRLGLGGFDYGTAIGDLNPEDIASVELLRGPAAAARYGGLAANGVLLVTTRDARGLNGFSVSASQLVSFETPLRLPSYQNSYGQGLGGAFSFFDGRGGGINDSVSQSWGTALLGQPVPQASFTEAARAEVRPWLPHPDNVRDYFDRGRTLATNVAAQGGNDAGQFRLSVGNRDYAGLTPQSAATRRSVALTSGYRLSSRLDLRGDLQYLGMQGSDRPGTGFDESNPVSVFALMGRQVDVQRLRDIRRDAKGNQISWHYSGHNNPYFAGLENDNHDDRTRWLGGGVATYRLSSWLEGSARAEADRRHDTRALTVATGWMGGFPYATGRGDFSTGGYENDDITATRTRGELALHATPTVAGPAALVIDLAAGRRGSDLRTVIAASDRTPATAPTSRAWRADGATTYLAGSMNASPFDGGALALSLRREATSISNSTSTRLYPAAMASVDLARTTSALRGGAVESLRLRGGWARSGNDITPALLQQLGLDQSTAATLPLPAAPEVTRGWELGVSLGAARGRVGLDLAYYADRSEDLIVPTGTAFLRGGSLTNRGLEAAVDLVPLRLRSSVEWRIGLRYARNESVVEALPGGAPSAGLAPAYGGVAVEARPGEALGVLVGTRYLRDAAGQLLLRNGLPLPDSAAGAQVIGSTAPSWIGGVSSGLRLGWLDLGILIDVRRGGRIFSASNRAGAYAGVLAETAFRPDTGLLVSGVDEATSQPNARHVTTEDYYHALGAVGERWVYGGGFAKLREARASVTLPLHALGLHTQTLRVAVIGRNLALWANAPNIDPETILSASGPRGAEMGQLPSARSVGVQVSLTP